MRCSDCKSRKYCDNADKVNYCAGYIFDDSKPQEQTNEEWFCSLSTEEKAKWLSQRSQILYDCGQRDVFPKIMYEEDWEWWLKQPHQKE